MNHTIMRIVALLVVLSGLALASSARAALPPVEDFFLNARIADASLSPSGKFVAMRVAAKGGRYRLAVVDVATMKPTVVGSLSDADVDEYRWLNDNRLVYDVRDTKRAQGDLYRFGPGLYAVNRDGSNALQLVEHSEAFSTGSSVIAKRLPWDTFLGPDSDGVDSDEVFMLRRGYDAKEELVDWPLLRLNTLTGRSTVEANRPDNAQAWLIDHTGVARIVRTASGGVSALHVKDASGQWIKLAQFDRFMPGKREITPVHFGPDGTLYVLTSAGGDTQDLYTFDLASKSLSAQPLLRLAGYDVGQGLGFINGKHSLLGIRFTNDAKSTLWLDATMKAIQKAVDDALPATNNMVSVGRYGDAGNVLVRAFSDVQPSQYYLFRPDGKKLTMLGSSQPEIKPAQMAQMDMVRYKARDGLEIPAYITLPNAAAKKNLPMVVLVHGGPWVRGATWQWDPQSQFLASRGYVVLQPEFRGSTGFGARHFEAGIKQWGRAMQDDIADGAKWAIAQGIADPKRICIAGASYGGYAALMGLVNDPELFRCGISWAAVTDINLMYSVSWSDTSEAYKQHGMPVMVGDPIKDAGQLKATSPIEQAARIRQPLLLAHGGADRRVPIVHGRKMYDSVRQHNAQAEWVVYPEEGHGWYLLENKVDFWKRVESFLNTHLSKP